VVLAAVSVVAVERLAVRVLKYSQPRQLFGIPDVIVVCWHRRRKDVWDGGKTTGGLGDGSPPAGSRGRAPVEGLGDFAPRS